MNTFAFLRVKNHLGEDLSSMDELKSALQVAGFNPSQDLLRRYWTSTTTSLSFQEFKEILELEPPPRKLDVLNAFRELDTDRTGFIDCQKLKECFGQGISASTKDVIENLTKDSRFLRGGKKFDYVLYVDDVFETTSKLHEAAIQSQSERDESYALNSRTYKVKKSPEKKSLKFRNCSRSKGAFYFEGDVVISHQLTFKVVKRAEFGLCIQPLPECEIPVDCQLFLFKFGKELDASPNSRMQFMGKSPLFIPDSNVHPTWLILLDPGEYLIIPCTTGCIFRKPLIKSKSSSRPQLIKTSASGVELGPEFRKVLQKIFDQVDLDGNGTLSRTEFNLFNWRTSGEEVQDDEWDVVKENFALSHGELTLEGFLQLHQMEAEDSSGDATELWVTLNAMGFDDDLKQAEASAFEVLLKYDDENEVKLQVSGLRAGGPLLDRSTLHCVLQDATDVRVLGDVAIHTQQSGSCAAVAIENKTNQSAKVRLDFSQSRNCLINHPHMAFKTSLSPKSTVFVAHLIPQDPNQDMSVQLEASLA